MAKVLYEKDGRIGRITLNRPEVMNAIDDDIPRELAAAVAEADADPGVHVMMLSGNGAAFCAGYDLTYYAQEGSAHEINQSMPWDPIKDYQFMWANTQAFMSLFRALKPVMADDAEIGYMPARVWGSPTTAMWVYRLGPERAKRMLFTGDRITGREAAEIGLVMKSVHADGLDREVEALAARMATVPVNQLAMQKMVINQTVEATITQTQRLATIFDGITRHSPEGLNFRARAEEVGWKQAVRERDNGTFDWTRNHPINPPG
jgi:enoyl-CoA hydratase